jgi:hypothetical protein
MPFAFGRWAHQQAPAQGLRPGTRGVTWSRTYSISEPSRLSHLGEVSGRVVPDLALLVPDHAIVIDLTGRALEQVRTGLIPAGATPT